MSQTKDVQMTTEIFKNPQDAEKAYNDAIEAGYKPEDINVLMSESSRKKHYDSVLVKEGNKAASAAGMGSVGGAAVGGVVAALAAIGTSLIVPGLGLVVAGPLAAGLAGAGAGSMAGGIVGALIGLGISEDKAKHFESGIKDGGIVLGVNDTRADAQLGDKWRNY